ISGIVSLSNASHVVNVADGSAADDLLISAAVLGGGATSPLLTKNGTGLLALTNANTFNGAVVVNHGILDARNQLALGAADGTTTSGTTVAAGATLRINPGSGVPGAGVGNELLTLNGGFVGSGVTASDGSTVTLDVVSGTNALGNVILGNAAAA